MPKDKQPAPSGEGKLDKYYGLKRQAVEDLVTADPSNSPPVSPAERRKYRTGGKGIHLADGLKIFLIKGWFAGVVCYFFIWGLSAMVPDQWDLMLITAIALGLVTDLLQNPILRYYAKTPGANNRWMMFPKKGFVSMPLNLLYSAWLVFCTAAAYAALNNLLVQSTGHADAGLGIGPVLFGALTAGWDLLFLTFKKIVADARAKVEGGGHRV
ncbi:MAG: hypothetical protein IKH38_01495 [Clostridia bacterium]|nr:hypothetical protein [Clostridia bacterium]